MTWVALGAFTGLYVANVTGNMLPNGREWLMSTEIPLGPGISMPLMPLEWIGFAFVGALVFTKAWPRILASATRYMK